MSRIFLVRHGQAVAGDFQTPDAARWLTAHGRECAHRAGLALRDAGVRPDMIVTSPLVRAVQTAEAIAQVFNFREEICAWTSLRPESFAQRSSEELTKLGAGTLVVVSHEPLVSSMSEELAPMGKRVSFQTAEVREHYLGKRGFRWRV